MPKVRLRIKINLFYDTYGESKCKRSSLSKLGYIKKESLLHSNLD